MEVQFLKERAMPDAVLQCNTITKEYVVPGRFWSAKKVITAVDSVSFQLFKGETLGLVGESGSGKSTLGEIAGGLQLASKGNVFYHNQDITKLSRKDYRNNFRRNVQFIFQDPKGSMNPSFKIYDVIAEPLRTFRVCKANEIEKKVKTIAEQTGLGGALLQQYPRELSGGQCQRVAIARALLLDPEIVICDEPVSALDVSVQAQILNLLQDLQCRRGIAYLFISHDMGVVNYMADQILVMKKGKMIEEGQAQQVFQNPTEEYTKQLIACSFA